MLPPIDSRTYDDIVAQTEALAGRYAGWQPPGPIQVAPTREALIGLVLDEAVTLPDPTSSAGQVTIASGTPIDAALADRIGAAMDAAPIRVRRPLDGGAALIRIFARMAELLIERLNQAPENNFLAFLNLLGAQALPPQPARAPLTFHLAAGSPTDALVPARTQVAATPVPGDPGPVIFETQRDLVVMRSQLAAAFTREPALDRYADQSPFATSQAGGAFAVFAGDDKHRTSHRLYLGNAGQFGIGAAKDITLSYAPATGDGLWLAAVQWTYWDGAQYQPLAAVATPQQLANQGQITFSGVPAIPPAAIGGWTNSWLCGTLLTTLPSVDPIHQDDQQPIAGFSNTVAIDFSQAFYPFGAATPAQDFYLACDPGYALPHTLATIGVTLDSTHPVTPSSDLVLAWEYFNGKTWAALGQSSPGATATAQSPGGFADCTGALSHIGAISFVCPADWTPSNYQGVPGLWLRARVDAGDYGTSLYQPPVVSNLSLSYNQPQPRLSSIQTSVYVEQSGLAPGMALANQNTIDLSKDFLPFGQKPRLGDTFYLASDAVFSVAGASVTMNITITTLGVPTSGVLLIWEFWDGQQWSMLGESAGGTSLPSVTPIPTYKFEDQTKAFTSGPTDGETPVSVTFNCPQIQPFAVGGQSHYWIRVRIGGGDYGNDAYYSLKDSNPSDGYVLNPSTLKPPTIKTIALDYTYTSPSEPPDATLAENDFAIGPVSSDMASPYQPMADTRPTFYLGFTAGFPNRPTTLYFDAVARPYDPAFAGQPIAEPAAVIWEYRAAGGWAPLLPQDETQSFTQAGLVTFIGPADIAAASDFGLAQLFWLRARWDHGQYAYPPLLGRVLTNTIGAMQATTIQNEALGPGTGEPGQVFQTARVPVLPGQRVEVREPEQPAPSDRAAIEAAEGQGALAVIPATTSHPAEIWVRWHEVPDFYASGPRSRHYTLDRLTGTVRFGDNQHGLAPPAGAIVRATSYQAGGGSYGNRPAGTITQLKRAVPYVDSVANELPAEGGADQEPLESVKRRVPRALRHGGRAVAIADFEDLAFEASPEVARARGIPPTSMQTVGAAQLIVVPGDSVPKPVPSMELLDRIHDYIAARLTPTADLFVRGPAWLAVSVIAEVVPLSLGAATNLQGDILARLTAFLHPLTGGPDGRGWEFGRQPYLSNLYALIQRTPGVRYVRSLTVETQPDQPAALGAGPGQPPDQLIYSGNHQITLAAQPDQPGF
jgi:hypothetical protein